MHRGTMYGHTCQVGIVGHKIIAALQLLYERVTSLHNAQWAPLAHLGPHILTWSRVHLQGQPDRDHHDVAIQAGRPMCLGLPQSSAMAKTSL